MTLLFTGFIITSLISVPKTTSAALDFYYDRYTSVNGFGDTAPWVYVSTISGCSYGYPSYTFDELTNKYTMIGTQISSQYSTVYWSDGTYLYSDSQRTYGMCVNGYDRYSKNISQNYAGWVTI